MADWRDRVSDLGDGLLGVLRVHTAEGCMQNTI